MDDCYSFKRNIEKAIQNRLLKEFFDKHIALDDAKVSCDDFKGQVINMITNASVGWSQERRQKVGGDVPLIISMNIEGYMVRRILVDTGSMVNIIYHIVLKAMGIKLRQNQLNKLPLVGFSSNIIYAKGIVQLCTT